ncbi:hypothetical protein Tco_0118374, partial [Tanacetum coccineum]
HRPRKAKRATEISQYSGPIPLVADETVTKEREDRMERDATTASSLEAKQDSVVRGAKIPYWEMQKLKLGLRLHLNSPMTHLSQELTHLRSGEDRLKLKELMELYTKLSDKVLNLETTKTTQAMKIANLKQRVKNLERKRKSRTPRMNLFKIDVEGDAEQVISAVADEVSTGDAVNTAGTEVTTGSVSVSTAEPITTSSVNITTAEPITPPTATTTVFEDEDLTIPQTLVKMRSEKSK